MKISAVVRTSLITVAIILGGFLATSAQAASPSARVKLLKLSSDPYTNPSAQHQTELSPASFSFGSTIVTAFEAGVFTDGGSSNIGWATSTNNGATWKKGFLPGTTVYATRQGAYARISNPAVAYDAKHNIWMIFSLGIQVNGSPFGAAVLVSRSADGGRTWSSPVTVQSAIGNDNLDKPWGVCDDTNSSPFFGNCYAEWDNAGNGALIQMSTSTEGGKTWGPAKTTADQASGVGGRPLVQTDGTVIVPIDNASESAVLAFASTNGGASWRSTVTVSPITVKAEGGSGQLSASPLISAAVDSNGPGMIYVVWFDCRFESNCSENDIVMSTSTDGTNWSEVQRIPADPVGSGVDHVLPAIAVDSSEIAVIYGEIVTHGLDNVMHWLEFNGLCSRDNGITWFPCHLGDPGSPYPYWVRNLSLAYTAGEHISISASSTGNFFPFVPIATAPKGPTLQVAIKTVKGGIS